MSFGENGHLLSEMSSLNDDFNEMDSNVFNEIKSESDKELV